MHFPQIWWVPSLLGLLAGAAPAAAAQTVHGPQSSPVWAAAADRYSTAPAPTTVRPVDSRSHGLALGAVVGGLAAGLLGRRMCQAYSATGACWSTAMWWGAIGGMLGGLIGASAAGDSDPAVEDPSGPAP